MMQRLLRTVSQEPYPDVPRALAHSGNSIHKKPEHEGCERSSQAVLLTLSDVPWQGSLVWLSQ